MRKSRKRYTHDQLVDFIARNEKLITEHLDAIIRIQMKLKDQRRKVARLEKLSKCYCATEPAPHAPHRALSRTVTDTKALADPKPVTAPPKMPEVKEAKDSLDIPAAFRRTPVNAADEKAKAELLAAQAERKKTKAAGRIAKMKAKQSGEASRMPLTGKAALAAIRGN